MFAIKTILFFVIAAMIVPSQGFSFPYRLVSRSSHSRHTTLNMMWDTKKMGGASSTIEQTKAPVVEEESIKELFRRVAPGSGSDDRFPTYPKEKEQEMEHVQLSRIDQSLRQKSLMMALEGSRFGEVDKLTLIARAVNEGTMTDSPKGTNMKKGGLLDDWNMTI